jgi:dihydroorotase
MLVTPGLIDVHVHVFPGVATIGIAPDVVGMARGVTTLIDAGSAGATTFPGFRAFVAREARTRVYALLNMSRPGLTLSNELADLDYVNPDLLATTIEGNRDVIVGIKVRMLAGIEGDQDLEVMRRTREVADRTGVPVTLHIGGQHSPLPRILDFLRPGDVITHALRRQGSILDGNGRVFPEVLEAQRNGVYLDVGHGMGNLDFGTAERVLDQGVLPDLISSDVHDGNANGPVFDLPTTLSKFLHLGMTLEQVLAAATSTPGKAFPFGQPLGTLAVGAAADISVLQLAEGEYVLVDSTGNRRRASERLTAFATFRDGLPAGSPGLG